MAALFLLAKPTIRHHHGVVHSEGRGDCGRHHCCPLGAGQAQQANGPGRVAFGDQLGGRVSVLLGARLEPGGCAAEAGVVEEGHVVDGHEDIAHAHAAGPPLLRHE